MTVGEVIRHINSVNRISVLEAKERATFDYILASLITKGVSISMGAKDSFPQIQDVYTELFKDDIEEQEAERQKKQAELSALRFKQFAQSYNNNYKNKEVLQEE